MYNGKSGNISMATNRVEVIYDFILGVGFVVLSILALSNLFIVTINKFVEYYSRQIDRIVMDESESECSDDDDGKGNCSKRHHHHHDDIELSPYIPPRRSERLAENRARCNSPLLVIRLKFE